MDDEVPLAAALHRQLEPAAGEFAQVKNIARRVLDMEDAAQHMTAELLALDYLAVSRGNLPLRRRIGAKFHDWRHHRGEEALVA
ncbi:hypothetical protein [Homoserinibacter gongjuensis]|nr:hypothetical protein [Homoserinibacter gongjuensis]